MSYRHGFTIALLFLQGSIVRCVNLDSILKEKEGTEAGNDSRIVGGHDAEKGRYPSTVAMFDEYGFFQCGGTLILPDVVLSAAHCIPHVARVEVGRHDVSKSVFEENASVFDIVKKTAHPNYGQTSIYQNDMDFALIKLSGNGAVHASTATLNGDSNFPGSHEKTITITGWGTTSEGGALSNVLQEVGVKCMPNDRCREKFSAYKDALTDDMMCANVDGGGKDACQGDSGGPAYLVSENNDPDKDLMIGVVSWGMGCARADYPGIYGRVAHPAALSWIREAACEMTGHKPCKLKVHTPHTEASNAQVSQYQEQHQQQSLPEVERMVEIIPEGGCYVQGEKFEVGECARSGDSCKACNGKWIKKFPSCFIGRYGYISRIKWCTNGPRNCKRCGGTFFESPPTLLIKQANARRHLFSGSDISAVKHRDGTSEGEP